MTVSHLDPCVYFVLFLRCCYQLREIHGDNPLPAQKITFSQHV